MIKREKDEFKLKVEKKVIRKSVRLVQKSNRGDVCHQR